MMTDPLDMTVRGMILRLETLPEDDQRVLGRHVVLHAQKLADIPGPAAIASMAKLLDALAARYHAEPMTSAVQRSINGERINRAISRLVRRRRTHRRFPRRSFYPLIAALHALRIGDTDNLQLAMQRFADVIVDPEGGTEENDEAALLMVAMRTAHDAAPTRYHMELVRAEPELRNTRCVLCLERMPF